MIELEKIDKKNIGFFRYKILNKEYLITGEVGDYFFLSKENFDKFINGELKRDDSVYAELQKKHFIKNDLNIKEFISDYGKKNIFLRQGPSLHIIVVTLRCDHNCVYCQVSAKTSCDKKYDMNATTAKKAVDLIFKTTNPSISIEFQGGEPLLNWEVVKFIIDYAIDKNKKVEKNLKINLMSNFSLMDDDKLDFLVNRKVGLSTSLDAPEQVHNKNRLLAGKKNSYKNTIKWIKKANKIYKEKIDSCLPGAVATVTKDSFPYYKEFVKENLALGFDGVYIRPLSPLGTALKTWDKIGYTPNEYISYYKNVLDYIIKINIEKGIKFYERGTLFILLKILAKKDPNNLDMRSPCGAGIGQLLYNYDGNIYTCDEGRMVKDDTFMIGNIDCDYEKIVGSDIVKSMCVASCLDGLNCDLCVYKPYCGVCPVFNYAQYGTLFPQLPNNDRCKINKGIFDYLFEKLQDEKVKKVFKRWINIYES